MGYCITYKVLEKFDPNVPCAKCIVKIICSERCKEFFKWMNHTIPSRDGRFLEILKEEGIFQ
jgi:hypothetical protein